MPRLDLLSTKTTVSNIAPFKESPFLYAEYPEGAIS